MRSKCWVDIQKPPRERRCIYKAIWLYISSFRCFWISNKLSQLFIKFLVYHILVWVYKCITIYRWKKKCDQIYHILFADYYNDALFSVWFQNRFPFYRSICLNDSRPTWNDASKKKTFRITISIIFEEFLRWQYGNRSTFSFIVEHLY